MLTLKSQSPAFKKSTSERSTIVWRGYGRGGRRKSERKRPRRRRRPIARDNEYHKTVSPKCPYARLSFTAVNKFSGPRDLLPPSSRCLLVRTEETIRSRDCVRIFDALSSCRGPREPKRIVRKYRRHNALDFCSCCIGQCPSIRIMRI